MARPPAAAARLDAVAAAKHVHRELDLQRRVTEGSGLVDVFESIGELNIPLVFKPLTSARPAAPSNQRRELLTRILRLPLLSGRAVRAGRRDYPISP